MASEWTPPASGTPCWIQIAVQDVARAQKFYGNALNWTFQDMSKSPHPEKYPADEIAFFHPPDSKSSPGGALCKARGAHHTKFHKSAGNAGLYFYVDDLEDYMKKIVEAGGKQSSEVIPEGDMGFMQHFEDTEGNYFGIYTVNRKADK